MNILNNLIELKKNIPKNVELVAVSKTKTKELILEAYNAGQRHFGENKIQEMVEKWKLLPKDIKWHMIGHVQTNKVKYMAPFVYKIHGVDSIKLMKEIQKQALKNHRTIQCLLQINISNEKSKFGIKETELNTLINAAYSFPNLKIKGLMGMASFTSNPDLIRKEFEKLANIFNKYENFEVLSMGMSNDYKIAIDEGSNMIRIGSTIFGERK